MVVQQEAGAASAATAATARPLPIYEQSFMPSDSGRMLSFGLRAVASTKRLLTPFVSSRPAFRTIGKQYRRFGQTPWELLFMGHSCAAHYRVVTVGCCGATLKGRTTLVTKIVVAVALVAFLAAPTASFAASKKSESDQQSESTQRGPYTPDIKTKLHGQSRDFQGGSIYYKRAKTKRHHSHSPANS
jgi:hypothetical protein